jgi:hypothetical protein
MEKQAIRDFVDKYLARCVPGRPRNEWFMIFIM